MKVIKAYLQDAISIGLAGRDILANENTTLEYDIDSQTLFVAVKDRNKLVLVPSDNIRGLEIATE